MEEKNVRVNGGLGLGGILTIIFVIFKLLGKITWSWWWVFAPVWIELGIVVIILIVYLIIALICR